MLFRSFFFVYKLLLYCNWSNTNSCDSEWEVSLLETRSEHNLVHLSFLQGAPILAGKRNLTWSSSQQYFCLWNYLSARFPPLPLKPRKVSVGFLNLKHLKAGFLWSRSAEGGCNVESSRESLCAKTRRCLVWRVSPSENSYPRQILLIIHWTMLDTNSRVLWWLCGNYFYHSGLMEQHNAVFRRLKILKLSKNTWRE